MSDADYNTFVQNGARWQELNALGDAASKAEMERLNAQNDKLRMKYGKSPSLGEYPQFHTGGKTLSYGMAYYKPGEMIFPPDLTRRMESLIDALYSPQSSLNKQQFNDSTGRIVNFNAPLYNSEKTSFEDNADEQSFSNELMRAVNHII